MYSPYGNTKTNNIIPTTNEISEYNHRKNQFDSVFGKISVEDNGQVSTSVKMIKIKEGKPIVIEEE